MSAGLIGGKLNASYNKFISDALQTSAIQFNFYAQGGSGLSSLSGMVTSLNDFDGIRANISNYIAGINESNTPPVAYYPQNDSTLDARLPLDEIPTAYERAIVACYFDYLICDNTLEALNKLLSSPPSKNCWIGTNRLSLLKASRLA